MVAVEAVLGKHRRVSLRPPTVSEPPPRKRPNTNPSGGHGGTPHNPHKRHIHHLPSQRKTSSIPTQRKARKTLLTLLIKGARRGAWHLFWKVPCWGDLFALSWLVVSVAFFWQRVLLLFNSPCRRFPSVGSLVCVRYGLFLGDLVVVRRR